MPRKPPFYHRLECSALGFHLLHLFSSTTRLYLEYPASEGYACGTELGGGRGVVGAQAPRCKLRSTDLIFSYLSSPLWGVWDDVKGAERLSPEEKSPLAQVLIAPQDWGLSPPDGDYEGDLGKGLRAWMGGPAGVSRCSSSSLLWRGLLHPTAGLWTV